jgi:threonine dehydrogenase-like Zn-dependent dehydrogenase
VSHGEPAVAPPRDHLQGTGGEDRGGSGGRRAPHLHGGPASVRRFQPDLIDLISDRAIEPGKVFDHELPLDQAAQGYRAMDERRAIKTLLRP